MFFRREVYVTYDMTEYGRVTALLRQAGIAYTYSTESPLTAGRSHGVPFIRQDAATSYHIYVKRKYYKKAMALLCK